MCNISHVDVDFFRTFAGENLTLLSYLVMYMNDRPKKLNCRNCKVRHCAAAVLDVEELDLINKSRHETTYKKGAIIIHEGSPTSHIIYLKTGLVKEYVKGAHEHEQILQIVKKFSYLGLTSLFGDKINHYSYAALEDITVCYIDISVFNQLIKQNGSFGYEILISIARDNLNNFNRFMKQSQKKTYGRVADAILYFSNIIYESKEFEIPFTRQELANLIGISRESATRVLTKFHEDEIVSLRDRHIRIDNLTLLQQISKNG